MQEYIYLRFDESDVEETCGDANMEDGVWCPIQQGIHHPGYIPYRMLRIVTVLMAVASQQIRSCKR